MKVAGMRIDLPSNWQWSKCNDVMDVRDGTHDTPKYIQSGYPLITSKNLKSDGIDFSDVSYISEEDHRDISKRSKVDKNDILFAMIGTIGNPVIVETDKEFSVKNVALFKFAKSYINPVFFKYLLGTPIIQRQLTNETRGGTQKFVSLTVLRNMQIPYPPLEEQKRIAAILDKADRVRRKRQEAIRLTEELGRSIFLDMFGDPVTNPKGWEIARLENLLNFMTSGSRGWAKYYANKGKIFLRIQNVKNGRLILEDVAFVNPPDNAEGTRTKVKEGDVLVSITADLGRTAVIPGDMEEAYINQHLVILRVKQDILSPIYLSSFISSEGGQRQFSQLDREGVKSGLNFSDLKGLSIVFPPMKEQRKYEEIYTLQLNQLLNQKRALEESENFFNSLLQRAFRGEL